MKIFLNSMPFRTSEDGWYQIAMQGEFSTLDEKDKPYVQVLDKTAFGNILQNFENEKAKKHFTGLLVDYDHASFTEGKSEAAGWIDDLQVRNHSELWAHIKLTPKGQEAIEGGMYRGISCSLGNKIARGTNRGTPLCLLAAGLTNRPNLKGMVPLSNKEPQDTGENAMKEQIISLLGLKEGASDEEITTALNSAITRANEAETLKEKFGALEEQNKVLLNAQVEADLQQYDSVINNAEVIRESLMADRKGTLKVLQSLKAPQAEPLKVVHNRETAKTPGTEKEPKSREAEQMAMVEEYKVAHNDCDFTKAWEACKRKNPNLFKPATSSED